MAEQPCMDWKKFACFDTETHKSYSGVQEATNLSA